MPRRRSSKQATPKYPVRMNGMDPFNQQRGVQSWTEYKTPKQIYAMKRAADKEDAKTKNDKMKADIVRAKENRAAEAAKARNEERNFQANERNAAKHQAREDKEIVRGIVEENRAEADDYRRWWGTVQQADRAAQDNFNAAQKAKAKNRVTLPPSEENPRAQPERQAPPGFPEGAISPPMADNWGPSRRGVPQVPNYRPDDRRGQGQKASGYYDIPGKADPIDQQQGESAGFTEGTISPPIPAGLPQRPIVTDEQRRAGFNPNTGRASIPGGMSVDTNGQWYNADGSMWNAPSPMAASMGGGSSTTSGAMAPPVPQIANAPQAQQPPLPVIANAPIPKGKFDNGFYPGKINWGAWEAGNRLPGIGGTPLLERPAGGSMYPNGDPGGYRPNMPYQTDAIDEVEDPPYAHQPRS